MRPNEVAERLALLKYITNKITWVTIMRNVWHKKGLLE
jgi:hypothetical protein